MLSISQGTPYEWEELDEILGLFPCVQWGELVSKVYLRLVGENICVFLVPDMRDNKAAGT